MSARHASPSSRGESAHDTDARQSGGGEPRPPMRVEVLLFTGLILWFLPVTIIYGFWSDWEPVGVITLLLLAGLFAMVAGYLWITSRRIDSRPEDDPLGEVEERAGEIGVFSPHSWWPFVLGIAVALAFLGVAIGWWITGLGVLVGVFGLIGQLFEFSRGQHAH